MGILSKLFGSEKVIESGMSAIDKIVFTEEEKADLQLARVRLKSELLKNYAPYKLAQRYMMLMVSGAFVGINVVLVMCWLFTLFMFYGESESYDFITAQILTIGEMNIKALGLPFVLIVGFYFGTGEVDISEWFSKMRAKK